MIVMNNADTRQMSPQAPPEKKKLYGMLALKQIQRAAQLAEVLKGNALMRPI
jgi:hypothetical protein